jgi:hypothetical protein
MGRAAGRAAGRGKGDGGKEFERRRRGVVAAFEHLMFGCLPERKNGEGNSSPKCPGLEFQSENLPCPSPLGLLQLLPFLNVRPPLSLALPYPTSPATYPAGPFLFFYLRPSLSFLFLFLERHFHALVSRLQERITGNTELWFESSDLFEGSKA